MKTKTIQSIILLLFLSTSAFSQFGSRIDIGIIESSQINEGSGIEASSKNPNVFWTLNDSGGENKIYAFSSTGKDLGSFKVNGSSNVDWEDISIGPGPIENEQYIYIADFGDNGAKRTYKSIYRIVEPFVDTSQSAVDTVLEGVTRLVFKYPEGIKYNAESLMIDPLTKDIFVVLKDDVTQVYKSTKPNSFHWVPDWIVDTLEIVDTLAFRSKANAADISDDGKEILIKDDNFVYYWNRDTTETVELTLSKIPKVLPYVKEPNGEGICWAADSSGYYTFSEGLHPHLYLYPRSVTSVELDNNLPYGFKLEQNYPNPFNPSTIIKYSIANNEISQYMVGKSSQMVVLKIYDILGREVETLVNKEQKPGNYKIQWDASNLSNGLYFYKLSTNGFDIKKKMILLK